MIALVLAGVYASGAVSAVLGIIAINRLWPADPTLGWPDDALSEPASELLASPLRGRQRGSCVTDELRRSL